MIDTFSGRPLRLAAILVLAFFMSAPVLGPGPAVAQGTGQATAGKIPAFAQAVAEAAARDKDIAAFYRETGYKPLWTGKGQRFRARRAALLKAIKASGDHGLPTRAYDTALLEANLNAVKSPRDLGRAEVALSKLFLTYARHAQTGVVRPRDIDPLMTRAVPLRDRTKLLVAFSKSSPEAFLRKLPPSSGEYVRLMREKLRLERVLGKGGWGPTVRAKALKPGQSGDQVIALRDRLVAMGYLRRANMKTYDDQLARAVQQFQLDHGLSADGVAGSGTIQAINVPVEDRLASVIVAMERERWENGIVKGKRHVWVNLADFTVEVVDNGKVTFKSRVVVGKNTPDRRSPEFSDVMEYLEINPSWNVPRSIAVKEYLPSMMKNPSAAGHLQLVDSRGRVVSRAAVDFSSYTAKSFPYNLRQPPSTRNALGLVKFMFPNQHNVYLHDTPEKALFSRDKRDFSHGCIRVHKPFDLAYHLLARQSNDPKGLFQSVLKSGRQTRIDLKEPVPVHLVYRTAFVPVKGQANYRADVYGRDAKIFKAMVNAGVALRAVGS